MEQGDLCSRYLHEAQTHLHTLNRLLYLDH